MDSSEILSAYLRGESSKGHEFFGAHPAFEGGKEGVRFTVYAPRARGVGLIGCFNAWNSSCMENIGNGVWTTFSPEARAEDTYKYRITTSSGEIRDHADPFAFYSQLRPETASIVWKVEQYGWRDGDWLAKRSKNFDKPLSIYEVHAGSWQVKEQEGEDRWLTYTELGERLVPYLKENGYTHLELLPLTEYPFDGSWGYQVSGYFSTTSRYGQPWQLMDLVDACHRAGIGVILDFVPAHFVIDSYALSMFDGTSLYEADEERDRYSQWGTAFFDFSKPHVNSFLHSALDFWLTRYHFDGIRYDAVSNLLYQRGNTEGAANEPGIWFLKSTNYSLQMNHPEVMLLAEDSSQYPKVTAPVVYGGLGFDYKWCLGWMHDTLDYLSQPFNWRGDQRGRLKFSMEYFYSDVFILPLSHDEVVHGKKTVIDKIYGSYEEKFSQLRGLYLYMFSHPGKKLNFMGNELAEFREWSEESQPGWNLTEYEAHRRFAYFFKTLQEIYGREGALFCEDYNMRGFAWVELHGGGPMAFALQRADGAGKKIYTVLNFSQQSLHSCRLPVEKNGEYHSLLQTDAAEFGGLGRVSQNLATIPGNPPFLLLNLPPLSGIMICL